MNTQAVILLEKDYTGSAKLLSEERGLRSYLVCLPEQERQEIKKNLFEKSNGHGCDLVDFPIVLEGKVNRTAQIFSETEDGFEITVVLAPPSRMIKYPDSKLGYLNSRLDDFYAIEPGPYWIGEKISSKAIEACRETMSKMLRADEKFPSFGVFPVPDGSVQVEISFGKRFDLEIYFDVEGKETFDFLDLSDLK